MANINALNREDRRRAQRVIAREIKRREDRKSPFARQYREEMMQACEIEVKGNHWYATLNGEKSELLADYIGKSQNMRPWASRKESSRALAASYARLAAKAMEEGDTKAAWEWSKRADETGSCAGYLEFEKLDDGSLRLKHAYFCHDPLCPICNWRRSIKTIALLTEAMDRLVSNEDQRVLHLVLTVPNVKLEELRETFQRMGKAFSRMTKQAWWAKRITGYYRKDEWTISYNPQMIAEGRIAHPHMHVLLTVPAEYFDSVAGWISKMATAFRLKNYNPMRSAARCGSYGKAVCSVRSVLAQWILDQASADGVDADTEMWRTKYRGRYQRLIRYVDEIAAKHRPSADADKDAVKAAVKAFAAEIAEVSDPLYIDEPEQRMFLRAWQSAYGDESIRDVSLQSVKVRRGSRTFIFGERPSTMKDEMKAAIKEIAKYVGKESDYILPRNSEETDRRVAILREQLKGLHTNSSGGLIKQYIAEVKEEWEIEDEDLVYSGPRHDDDGGEERRTVIARWNVRLHAYVIEKEERRKDGDMQDGGLKDMCTPFPGERRCSSVPESVQLEIVI